MIAILALYTLIKQQQMTMVWVFAADRISLYELVSRVQKVLVQNF